MTFTMTESPWINLRPGDAGYQLQGDYSITDRAFIEVTNTCPQNYAEVIAVAIKQQWIRPVAAVPRNDPTLIWETLKNE